MCKISTVFVFLASLSFGKIVTSQVIQEGNDTDGRILGGSPARAGQFPYQVQLRHRNTVHYCGGSIISNLWILTAAHCFNEVVPQDLLVVTGTIDRSYGGVLYSIVQAIIHEGYEPKPSFNNDIALVRVDHPIEFTINIRPIQLASNAPPTGLQCIVSGWGMVNSPRNYPRFLFYLNQGVADINHCQSSLGPYIRITNICGFNDFNRASCVGDSGGPFVCNGVQYGIVSWGRPCGKGFPDVYTSVYAYRSWIASKTGLNV